MKQWNLCEGSFAKFNEVEWVGLPGVEYCYDYGRVYQHIRENPSNELRLIRELCQRDLFFLVCFVMRVPRSNHAFVVGACRDVQTGARSHTLDTWAREHFKTTIISIADPVQRILNNCEETVGIFSYAKDPALAILRSIKTIFEQSEILKWAFPDVLWGNPRLESPSWGEDRGIVVKRKGFQKEATVEAHGLIEGMPTGKHFTHRVYDDVVTEKIVPPNATPEMMSKVKTNFDLSENLGSEGGTCRIVGTFYHYEDPLVYIRDKKTLDGAPVFVHRVKAATEGGAYNGGSVFLSEERLAILRTNKYQFACQQLLDPTPVEMADLDPGMLVEVEVSDIPKRLFKFMTVDFAGVNQNREGDSWAVLLVGVSPMLDDTGGSDVYILDAVIEPMSMESALSSIVEMYCRGGVVWQVGVEKVGATTMEVHVKNALKARGRANAEVKTLTPAGRKKQFRILQNLEWPLRNGKVRISKGVAVGVRERLKMEMRKFPYWHDDGLDALAYVYDLLKEFPFARKRSSLISEKDAYSMFTRQSELDPKSITDQPWLYV